MARPWGFSQGRPTPADEIQIASSLEGRNDSWPARVRQMASLPAQQPTIWRSASGRGLSCSVAHAMEGCQAHQAHIRRGPEVQGQTNRSGTEQEGGGWQAVQILLPHGDFLLRV